MTTMLPHQLAAFNRLKDNKYIALFWTMGYGKTKTAIDIAVHKYRKGAIDRVLVIAPNTVHNQWIEEQLPKHCTEDYTAFAYSNSKNKSYLNHLKAFMTQANTAKGFYWLAVYVDVFSREIPRVIHDFCAGALPLDNGKKTLIIVDEATRIKTPKARRTKNIISLHKKYRGPAMILTGTALAKRPADAWALFEFMDHDIINSTYKAFEESYTVLMSQQFTMARGGKVYVDKPIDEFTWNRCKKAINTIQYNVVTRERSPLEVKDIFDIAYKLKLRPADVKFISEQAKFTQYKNIEKLKAKLAPFTDFVDESLRIPLPEKRYNIAEVPLSAQQKKILADLKKYAVAESEQHVLTVQNKATYLLRALQVCGGFISYEDSGTWETSKIPGTNNKLQYLLENVEELGNSQFIVFAVFRAEIELLTQELAKLVSTKALYGDTKDRTDLIDKFKRGEIQCLVCNPSVAGYGLNLQNATKQYWYSRSFRTEDRIQAEGRSHRLGIIESPLYTDIICATEFEHKVLTSNKTGQDLNDYFNNTSIKDILR